MADRPRILVFDSPGAASADPLRSCLTNCDLVRVTSVAQGMALLQTEAFDGVFASTSDPRLWQRAGSLLQTDFLLEVLGEGVAIVQPDLRILWANATFDKWCASDAASPSLTANDAKGHGEPTKGKPFYEALGSPQILGPDYCPFHTALAGRSVTTRLHRHDGQYLELRIAPVGDQPGKVDQLISLLRDVTAEVQQQQKLDALHQAGRELASLTTQQLAEMDADERVELLKHNIRRLTKDLLHYDVIEIRLLDPNTGRLEPLVAEGMLPEAASRVLHARAEGNGVTGFVAATGKSYVCPDTATDPLYIEGAKGARSSLTIALTWAERVIGTFNVESPQLGGFTEQDVQFAEIFCRELSSALHTLELLTAEKRTTASRSIDAVNREVALPVDEILHDATALLERWIGHEPEMAEKIKNILAAARSIKQCIQKVGENLAPASAPGSSAPDNAANLKGQRVLVVDNDERVRRSAHNILGRFGCFVETARDGKEALTMARLSTYDAVLADIRLPDISGSEAYRNLRQAQPKARVILMTSYGYDPSHAIVKARQEGLRHVLYKPFRVDQLLDALQPQDGSEILPSRAV